VRVVPVCDVPPRADAVRAGLVRPVPLPPDPVVPEPLLPDPVLPDPVLPDPVLPDPVLPDPVLPDPVLAASDRTRPRAQPSTRAPSCPNVIDQAGLRVADRRSRAGGVARVSRVTLVVEVGTLRDGIAGNGHRTGRFGAGR
jgi:hypothetical protein